MNIGGTTIHTPFIELGDNAMLAKGDWVSAVAIALADSKIPAAKLPAPVKASPEYPHIQKHVEFLGASESALYGKSGGKLRMHKIATNWAELPDGPRIYIDPMLLGGKPFADIAKQLDDGRTSEKHMLELVKLYEMLFMHCRRHDGNPLPKPQLHCMALAGRTVVLPGDPPAVHWRVKAAKYGIDSVEPLWGEQGQSVQTYIDNQMQEVRIAAINLVDKRVVTGEVYTKDAISVLSIGEDSDKRKSDERLAEAHAGSQASDAFHTLVELLALSKPTQVPVEKYASQQGKVAEAEKRSLASEKKISKTTISDRGPGAARDAIDKKLSSKLDKEATKATREKAKNDRSSTKRKSNGGSAKKRRVGKPGK